MWYVAYWIEIDDVMHDYQGRTFTTETKAKREFDRLVVAGYCASIEFHQTQRADDGN